MGNQGSPKGRGLLWSPEKNVGYTFKYAVIDIKPTYNHQIFLSLLSIYKYTHNKNFIWGVH